MGCWNETCGVTNLPIMSDEAIVCYIVRHTNYDGWRPTGVGIECKYNSYGSISEAVVTPEVDYLRKQLLSKAVLKNPSYVDGFDTLEDDPSIENVATYIERGSLFLKAGGKEERAALFLVRKNVHDLMVNFHGKASHYKHDNVASVEEELAMMKEDLGKQLFTELHLFPASSGYNLPEVPETSSNRALAILKLYRFDHMLSRLRKTWSPETAMYYAGSQQKDWFIYRAVYEEALKEIDLEEQNYEDENGDG